MIFFVVVASSICQALTTINAATGTPVLGLLYLAACFPWTNKIVSAHTRL